MGVAGGCLLGEPRLAVVPVLIGPLQAFLFLFPQAVRIPRQVPSHPVQSEGVGAGGSNGR